MTSEADPLETRNLAGGVLLVEDVRGSARLSRVAPGAVLYVCAGYLSGRFYRPMVDVAQREIEANGRLAMFVDGWHLRAVQTEFREDWTRWFKSHQERFHMRLLVRSKLMEMAASLANLFTGVRVIDTYSNLATWERACRKDCPAFHYVPHSLRPEG